MLVDNKHFFPVLNNL